MKKIILFILIIMSIMLNGCMNPDSLDRYGYVLFIGVDVGIDKEFEITFLIQNNEIAQERSNEDKGFYTISEEGNDLFEAKLNADKALPFEINFSRTGFVIFSKDVSENGKIKDFFAMILSSLKLRPSTNMLISENSAKDFINGLENQIDPNVSKMLENIIKLSEKYAIIPSITFQKYLESCNGNWFDAAIPLGKKSDKSDDEENGEMQSVFSGTALFDSWTMTGMLNNEESMFLLMCTEEFSSCRMEFIDKNNNRYSLLLEGKKMPQKYVYIGSKLKSDIYINLCCNIEYDNSSENIIKDNEWRRNLENQMEAYIKEKVINVFEKCKQSNSDAMMLGCEAVKSFSTVKEWEEYDWKSKYQEIEVTFNIDIDIDGKYISSYME